MQVPFLTANAQALSGTYTIGSASGSNYSSFTSAVTDLVSKGVNGAVIFLVAPGNYNEAIRIPFVAGVSASNTITFTGAGIGSGGTRIYYSLSTSGTSVIYLDSASYVTIGNMTVENTNPSTSLFGIYPACIGTRHDHNNTITNCNIKTAISTSTQYNVVGIHLFYCRNATIINCHVSGGLFGIYNEAYSGNPKITFGSTLIKGSRFVGAYYNHIYGLSNTYGLSNDVYDGNTYDSSTSPYISAIQLSYENGATIKNNVTNGNVASYLPIEIDYPNYGYNTQPFMVYNNMVGNFQYQGLYIDAYNTSNLNMFVLHNTIDEENNKPSDIIYATFSSSSGCTIKDNLLSANSPAIPLYIYTSVSTKGLMVDGNDYYNTGGAALVTLNSASFTTLIGFQSYVSAQGWSLYDNNIKPQYKSKRDLHLDQSVTNPSGVYAGIDVDIDGDARCKLFPTTGADESTFGTGKPFVKIYLPSKIYPNSPTYVFQSAKPGEAKRHAWYVNGIHVSDSIVLLTDQFVVGQNTLKLVTFTCFSSDSATEIFNVTNPTAVPSTDFIVNFNRIHTNDIVTFHDLSSNGPTKWLWVITPDSIISGGIKIPSIKYTYGNLHYQNPQVKFLFPGKYRVCLTASNGIGKGANICKNDYIVVVPAVILGTTSVVHDPAGDLYDNGGPNGDYNYDPKIESIIIDPCADSVFLTFSAFDLYCGYDYLRLFEGRNMNGKNLSVPCTNTGSFDGYGPGFTGGKAYPGGCGYQCMPNVLTPDTFKAKQAMFIEMVCYAAYQSAGFAAHWWSTPRKSPKPKASFTSSADSVCTNRQINFINTTTIDPKDPATFIWDLDGDITTFECIGTCPAASYVYYLPGALRVSLIAINCGGSDTAIHDITVYTPAPPKVTFSADNMTPTTSEYVNFTEMAQQCIENYKWTITPSPGNNTGTVTYINGTNAKSPNPQVTFSDIGYYDVKLYEDNLTGTQKDSTAISKYIYVRPPYCVPQVVTLDQQVGIFKVIFNGINNTTAQASKQYTNFVNNPTLSATVAKGLTYSLTLTRNPLLLTEAINRDIYFDWNADGSFVGKGEIVASDSNSTTSTFKVNITIPQFAKVGATVMRIAVNRAAYSNKPCGTNEYGEYQDYRVFITPYNILPVITLKGQQGLKDTIKVEQGYPFMEPGYSASAFLYGNITKNVKRTSRLVGSINPADSFNSLVVNNLYIFSYNVTDSAGNNAITQYRIVRITKDKTPPNLLVVKPDTILIAVTSKPLNVAAPKVISSIDLIDGPRSVTIDSSVKILTNVVGVYIVTYTSADKSGNTIKVYRVFKVIDTIKPVLSLIGHAIRKIEVYSSYSDSGVLVTDNYYSVAVLKPLIKVKSNLDTSKTGAYKIIYNVTDPSGNKDSVIRIVIVMDTIKPVIKLRGALVDSVEVFKTYKDPGFIVSDNYDKPIDISMVITGSFFAQYPLGNANIIGPYSIIYTATDKAGNTSTITRKIKVQDRTAPVISLIGSQSLSVCRWFKYIDAGYTLSDNYDSIKNLKVDTFGNFRTQGGTTIENLLTLRYRATDLSGNVGLSEPRIISVKASTDASCASGIDPGQSLEKYISIYPNPNSGIFKVNGNLPMAVPGNATLHISVANMLGQQIEIVYDGILTNSVFSHTVDFRNQPSGIYMLTIATGNEVITKLIEVQK